MSEPIFDPKWVRHHRIPEWRFKLLAFFGLARKVASLDLDTATSRTTFLGEGYWVAGTFYITKMGERK